MGAGALKFQKLNQQVLREMRAFPNMKRGAEIRAICTTPSMKNCFGMRIQWREGLVTENKRHGLCVPSQPWHRTHGTGHQKGP